MAFWYFVLKEPPEVLNHKLYIQVLNLILFVVG